MNAYEYQLNNIVYESNYSNVLEMIFILNKGGIRCL